jgi:hypothetical protein
MGAYKLAHKLDITQQFKTIISVIATIAVTTIYPPKAINHHRECISMNLKILSTCFR